MHDLLPVFIALIGAAATVVASVVAAHATRRTGKDNLSQHSKVQEHLLKLSETAVEVQRDVAGLRNDVVVLQDDVRSLKGKYETYEIFQVP